MSLARFAPPALRPALRSVRDSVSGEKQHDQRHAELRAEVAALRGQLAAVGQQLQQVRAGQESAAGRCLPLGPDELLVRTAAGFHVVVPPWNIDVAIGAIRDGVIEPWTNEVVRHALRPGDVFVNVGANFGYYAAFGAQCVDRAGRVYAVEANPHIFVYLLKTMFWAGYPDVIRPFQFAAYSEPLDALPLLFDRQFLGGGSVIEARGPGVPHLVPWAADNVVTMLDDRREWRVKGLFTSVTTPARRLDDTLPADRPVRLLQMDIEGAEPHAILGARELIRRSPGIHVLIEWWPGHYEVADRRPTIDAMWDFLLGECKLRPHRINPDGFQPGRLPRLDRLTRESLMRVPHGDIYLTPAD